MKSIILNLYSCMLYKKQKMSELHKKPTEMSNRAKYKIILLLRGAQALNLAYGAITALCKFVLFTSSCSSQPLKNQLFQSVKKAQLGAMQAQAKSTMHPYSHGAMASDAASAALGWQPRKGGEGGALCRCQARSLCYYSTFTITEERGRFY